MTKARKRILEDLHTFGNIYKTGEFYRIDDKATSNIRFWNEISKLINENLVTIYKANINFDKSVINGGTGKYNDVYLIVRNDLINNPISVGKVFEVTYKSLYKIYTEVSRRELMDQ